MSSPSRNAGGKAAGCGLARRQGARRRAEGRGLGARGWLGHCCPMHMTLSSGTHPLSAAGPSSPSSFPGQRCLISTVEAIHSTNQEPTCHRVQRRIQMWLIPRSQSKCRVAARAGGSRTSFFFCSIHLQNQASVLTAGAGLRSACREVPGVWTSPLRRGRGEEQPRG